MSHNRPQYLPRRRPWQKDSIPPRTEIRTMRKRVTSGGSIVRQSQHVFNGDSTTEFPELSVESNLPNPRDLFFAEDFVIPQPSRVEEEPPEVPNKEPSQLELVENASIEQERVALVVKFNKQNMDKFEQDDWLFQ